MKIYINESQLETINNSEKEITYYEFNIWVRNFLKLLLSNPAEAEPNASLKQLGLNKKDLIKKLKKRGMLTSDENITEVPNEDDETKKRAKYVIKYSVPRKNFERNMHRLHTEICESEWKPKSVLSDEAEEIRKILDMDDDNAYKDRGGYKL